MSFYHFSTTKDKKEDKKEDREKRKQEKIRQELRLDKDEDDSKDQGWTTVQGGKGSLPVGVRYNIHKPGFPEVHIYFNYKHKI